MEIAHPATARLRSDHDGIRCVLDAVACVSDRLAVGRPVLFETLGGICEYLDVFANRCHHAKEERLLLPALEARGLPTEPSAQLLREHEADGALVEDLRAAAAAHRDRQPTAAIRWRSAALALDALVREHLEKEERYVFGLADAVLTPQEQLDLASGFEAIEDDLGEGFGTRIRGVLEQACEALGLC